MEIKVVSTRQDLMDFIKFPWKIYKGDKYWVPPLIMDMKHKLDTEKNPFYKHAKSRFFLAIDKGEIVGRIAGIIDRNYIEFQNNNIGFFAFFETINDKNVAKLLLDTVKSWLKENNVRKMMGPTAPSSNDEMGVLFEGFDSSPYLMMPYNPRYYPGILEQCGLRKANDLFAFWGHYDDTPRERLQKLFDGLSKRTPDLVLRKINLKNFKQEIETGRQIYNNAWEKNWGFVPWTDEEFQDQCTNLKQLVVPDFVHFAMIKDKPVGMIIAVPNYYEVFKRLNGKLGPVEILKFLYYKGKIKSLRIMIMGVNKEFRNRGIEGLLYLEVLKAARKLGYNSGEMSWILETNTPMCRSAEMLGGKISKKYRVFEGEIQA